MLLYFYERGASFKKGWEPMPKVHPYKFWPLLDLHGSTRVGARPYTTRPLASAFAHAVLKLFVLIACYCTTSLSVDSIQKNTQVCDDEVRESKILWVQRL